MDRECEFLGRRRMNRPGMINDAPPTQKQPWAHSVSRLRNRASGDDPRPPPPRRSSLAAGADEPTHGLNLLDTLGKVAFSEAVVG
jgi:hypothetical protein